MNRGTASKWVARLRLEGASMCYSQLGYDYAGDRYRCPIGVLCDFIYPNAQLAWDGVSKIYDGEQFYPSEGLGKAVKSKGGLLDMVELRFSSFEDAAVYVETHYPAL